MFLEFNNDGPRGGGPHADGLTAPVHNMANTPIETIEAAQPLLIRRYGFVPDSGGPGRFRGGLGLVREYQFTHDEATLQVRSDRARFLPWGTQGGSSGTAGSNLLNPDRGAGGEPAAGQVPAHPRARRRVPAGAAGRRLRRSAGADAEAVWEDASQDKISAAHARTAYGVVLAADGRGDPAATAALRKRRKRNRGPLATEPHVQRVAETQNKR